MGRNSKLKRDKRKTNKKAPKVLNNKVKKTRPTLGLAMIMKDEIEDLDRIIKRYGKVFDKIYVTVTHQETYDTLRKRFQKNVSTADLVELSYFKWIDHFGKARNYNLSQVKSDYWIWIDLDDEIDGAEKLPQLIDYIEKHNLDAVFFEYDYIKQVDVTDLRSVSWRERIIRTSSKLKWSDEPVHETVISTVGDEIKKRLLTDIVIKHRKTADLLKVSALRNKAILENDWKKQPRATTASYLGTTLRDLGDYEGAIEKLLFVVKNSNDKAECFAACQYLCECYFKLGQYDSAITAANTAIAIDKEHPDPWYQLFGVYQAMGSYDLAMQAAEVAISKPIDAELTLLRGHDPLKYQYKAPFSVAQAYLSLGNIERAYEIYTQVKNVAPEYINEMSAETGTEWADVFENSYKELKTNPQLNNRINELLQLVTDAAKEGKPFDGTTDGAELNYLARLAMLPSVKKIAEIGFNGGASSYAFLYANPETTVVSFDLGEFDYCQKAKAIIDEQFPNRHTLIIGDSTKTVPEYYKTHPDIKFDLIFIDGGHDYKVAKLDIENMKKFATKNTILMTDDITPWLEWGVGPSRAWTEAVESGQVIQEELYKDGVLVDKIAPPGIRSWVRGKYLNP